MGTMLFRMNQPPDLVDSLIKKLPRDLFTSTTTHFLDPGMGDGDYLRAIVKELKGFGQSKENILSRIHGFETNKIYINLAKRQILQGADLRIMKYDDILKNNNIFSIRENNLYLRVGEEWVKIDCVITNPPYQSDEAKECKKGKQTNGKKVDQEFFNKFCPFVENYVFIMSSNWVGDKSSKFRKKVLGDKNLEFMISSTSFFKEVKGMMICSLVKNQNYSSPYVKIINNKKEEFLLKREEVESLIISKKSLNIIEKLRAKNIEQSLASIWFRCNDFYRKKCNETGKYKVVEIAGPRNRDEPTYGFIDDFHNQKHFEKWKTITNASGEVYKLGAIKIAPPHLQVCRQVVFFPFDSKEEAENMKRFLESKIVYFLSQNLKETIENSKTFFSNIPLLDFTKSYSDEELYRIFLLTNEEINDIELLCE